MNTNSQLNLNDANHLGEIVKEIEAWLMFIFSGKKVWMIF